MTANICRNAAAIAFRLGGRITTGTPFRPQNVDRNGVPVPLHHWSIWWCNDATAFAGYANMMMMMKYIDTISSNIRNFSLQLD